MRVTPLWLPTGFAVALIAVSSIPGGRVGNRPSDAKTSPPLSSAAEREVVERASHALNDIALRAIPSVVSITAIRMRGDGPAPLHAHRRPLSPLGRGPGHDFAPVPEGSDSLSIGSGVIIKSDGTILTNHHVVEGASRITVSLGEDRKVAARLLGGDQRTDLALIKIDGVEGLPTLKLGDSDGIKIGDWAIAIGTPFGLSQSVTFGIISARGRARMGILDTEDFIQTDAAINPGSSGGPLLNGSGDVIGINTAIFSQDGGNIGIGFAVPARIAREVSQQILTSGRVIRGWIGLAAQDLDRDLARFFKSSPGGGALVSDVAPAGPASRAGLRSGDIVTSYDGKPVAGAAAFKALVGGSEPGRASALEVIRDGAPATLTVNVEEQPGALRGEPREQAGQIASEPSARAFEPPFGLVVQDVPVGLLRTLRINGRSGALITQVKPGSAAFESGVIPGDVILKANGVRVSGAREFNELARRLPAGEAGVLYIQRGPLERLYVSVRPGAT